MNPVEILIIVLLLLSGLTVNRLILPAIRKANLFTGNIVSDVVVTEINRTAVAPQFINLSNEIKRPIKESSAIITKQKILLCFFQ